MRFCSIASGSSGNCIYVGSDTTHLLIDAGISARKIEMGLAELELTGRDIDGILITHEHSDHIAGLTVLCKKYSIPLFATRGTIKAIVNGRQKNIPDPTLFQEIEADSQMIIKDLKVWPMRISHDAAEPVGYRVGYGNKKVAVCTDLGTFDDYTVACLTGLDALLLEANHDVNMLQVGPYPYYLKQRILGNRGHLSNENAGRLLDRVLNDKIQAIMLGHLSKENNMPELAHEAVRMEITMGESRYKADDFPIYVAARDALSPVIEL